MYARRLAAFACLTGTLLAVPLAAQEQDPNRRTIEGIKQTLKQRPNDPTLYYYLAAFQARVGDKADAVANLGKLADIGEGFLPTGFIGFDKIWDDAAFKQAFAKLEAKLPRVADAKVAFELPDKNLIPEGIAYDPVSKRFFVGSTYGKYILSVDASGKAQRFTPVGDKHEYILGVAVDAKKRELHFVCTSALTEAGRKQLVNAVVTYDLKTGKKAREVSVPKAAQLNDVTVAPNSDLYASDSASGAIWRIRSGNVEVFLPEGQARGSNGVAVSGDGNTVYVGHSTGIVRVDAASGALERMPPPQGETVAGIDGLYWHQGDLLGVQNVTNPGRIIRVKLASDGKSIKSVETLQSHHNPAFDEPTTGAVANDAFYVLATTQVARLNDKGELERPETAKNAKVVRIPL
jgi:hypothetical protein